MSVSILNYILLKEEQLISKEIKSEILSEQNELIQISQSDLELINSNLLRIDASNFAFKAHKQIIDSLITVFINSKFHNQIDALKDVFHFGQINVFENVIEKYIFNIPDLLEELHVTFLNSAFSFEKGKIIRKRSKHHLKESGAVYTLKQITNEIVENTIGNCIQGGVSAQTITCLDFACGTGRFYFEALETLKSKYNLQIQQIICKNLFAVDNDEIALSILRCKILSLFTELDIDLINALTTNIINRNALIPKTNLLQELTNNINLSDDFNNITAKGGFDVVFSNPPYYLLKVNKKDDDKKLNDYYINLQNRIINEIKYFRTSGFYQYSIEGMLNYYQLSIEMIIRLTKQKGQIGIICPSSLFADLTSTKLRKYILNSHKLYFIRYYPEASKLFDNVIQSTVIFYLQKSCKTDKINIEILNNSFDIDLNTIKNIFPSNLEIPLIDKTGWNILTKISKYKKLKDISYIRNRRGELDLTLYKSFISNENTGWRLVRGNMITDKGVINKNNEFVEIEGFLNKKSVDFKNYDLNNERLICQQISNIDMKRRLKFVFCEKTDILGNSCNYIVSTRKQADLKKLYNILNSSLLNWRFKITSSNNHINNYELDELPIIDLDNIELNDFSKNEYENDKIVCFLYGLTQTETMYILANKKRIESEVKYENEIV